MFGKSVVSSILSKYISSKNKKTLVMDFELVNGSINTIFGNKRIKKVYEKNNLNSYIFDINKNLKICCGIDEMLDMSDETSLYKIKELINILKKEYEVIIIDTSSRTEFKFIKLVLSNADKIIFLIEPNLLELKKSNNLLEILLKDWNIGVDKIKIVFNKTNKYKIAESILEEIFSEFEIAGNLEYQEQYNLFINKNTNINFNENEYKKIYEKI